MPGEIWGGGRDWRGRRLGSGRYGFDATVVESVNVHDDIKIGLPDARQVHENYKQHPATRPFGDHLAGNFMPILTGPAIDLFHPVGVTHPPPCSICRTLIQDDYKGMANYILELTEKYNMTFFMGAGAHAKLDELFKAYAPATKEKPG